MPFLNFVFLVLFGQLDSQLFTEIFIDLITRHTNLEAHDVTAKIQILPILAAYPLLGIFINAVNNQQRNFIFACSFSYRIDMVLQGYWLLHIVRINIRNVIPQCTKCSDINYRIHIVFRLAAATVYFSELVSSGNPMMGIL